MANHTIDKSDYYFEGQTSVYHGKVRDVYLFDDLIVMIASDRISAFDCILPRPIPYKGQVLNQIASQFLQATNNVVPNWLIACPDPMVSIGKKCTPIKLEMVVRGYLAGHAWREYSSGKKSVCGVDLPEGLNQSDKLPYPIITPTTKADAGHDQDISEEQILAKNIVTPEIWDQLKSYSLVLFDIGTKMAAEQGLILVDTKYEFGLYEGQVTLMDEIHTPDSSRYFYLDGYQQRQAKGEQQVQLSKEFVREWLMARGFSGKEGQLMPDMPDDFVNEVSEKYIGLYKLITGKTFSPHDSTNIKERIETNIKNYLSVHK